MGEGIELSWYETRPKYV